MTCAAHSPLDRAEIERIARAYPPGARLTPEWERERYFTDAQRAAWELRFGRQREAAQ